MSPQNLKLTYGLIAHGVQKDLFEILLLVICFIVEHKNTREYDKIHYSLYFGCIVFVRFHDKIIESVSFQWYL